MKIFYDLGLNIFIFDYRGYGKSEGTPTEQGIYQDTLAAFDYISRRPDLEKKRIVAYGESLGGVAVIDLAVKRSVAALIIDSSFSSAVDMAQVIYSFIPSFLIQVRMNSADKIKNIMAPKLMIHSINDQVVPFRLGKKLFDAAADPKEFLQITGGHNEGYVESKEKYWGGIKRFLQEYKLL